MHSENALGQSTFAAFGGIPLPLWKRRNLGHDPDQRILGMYSAMGLYLHGPSWNEVSKVLKDLVFHDEG